MEQQTLLSVIATDTLKGLSSQPKYLLSKYFYDDVGSVIFQDIMKMPEYYLTDCEFEIFSNQKNEITKAFLQGGSTFDLIELGPGDGMKTKILLQHMVEQSIDFRYIPFDISQKSNIELVKSLHSELPALKVNAKTGDYFQVANKLNRYTDLRKIILFLGSNIGNFSDDEISRFLTQLSGICNQGDKTLIGFDLKKSPKIIMNAYNDPHGHTRRFTLNHLDRLNRELNAGFNPETFEHHTEYNPVSGAVKSFLVSKTEQKVFIGALDTSFHFKKWEPVFMELSRKFDLGTIGRLAENYGFKIDYQFTDSRNYFVDSLWIKS